MSIRLNSKEQEELVLKNQGLIRCLVNKLEINPNSYEDMISIGQIGLIKAAATFDKSKNIAFSTYAGKCINNEIFMYFRKEKSHINDISLDALIIDSGEGKKITIGDKIPSSEKEFEEEIVNKEIFINFISVVLNVLEPRERLVMLYKIAGINQGTIAKTLKLSQSYISRLEIKSIKKVKLYLNTTKQFKEFFSMLIVGDSYKISFDSKDIKEFKKSFVTFLQNLIIIEDLPDFKISCNKERIIIQIPAHPESFSFIAKIFQEIDEFTMTHVYKSSNNSVLQVKGEDVEKRDNTVKKEVRLNM